MRRAVWIARIGTPIYRVLGSTWRVRIEGGDLEALLARKEGVLGAFLHGRLLAAGIAFQNRGIGIMSSHHADGELIHRVVRKMGYVTVRGSTTRGGSRALIEMARLAPETPLALTPDGPRGPEGKLQDGFALLASKTGRAIIPTGIAASSCLRLGSWDRMVVPLPFSRIQVVLAEPIVLPPDLSREEIRAATARVRAKILEVEREAWKKVGKDPVKELPPEGESSRNQG